MSSPQPPTRPPTTPEVDQYNQIKHNLSLGLLIACPLILALPPRKLDLYTFSLTGAWVLSANQMTRERTGRSILEQIGSRAPSRGGGLPTEKAAAVQERLKQEGLLRAQPYGQGSERGRERGDEQGGLLKKAWMGKEEDGWKERRVKEEKDGLAEGKGYGGLIYDHVVDSWTGKKGEGGDGDGEGKR